MDNQPQDQNTQEEIQKVTWFKRIGIGAFLFFLLKGIVWIFVFLGIGKSIWG